MAREMYGHKEGKWHDGLLTNFMANTDFALFEKWWNTLSDEQKELYDRGYYAMLKRKHPLEYNKKKSEKYKSITSILWLVGIIFAIIALLKGNTSYSKIFGAIGLSLACLAFIMFLYTVGRGLWLKVESIGKKPNDDELAYDRLNAEFQEFCKTPIANEVFKDEVKGHIGAAFIAVGAVTGTLGAVFAGLKIWSGKKINPLSIVTATIGIGAAAEAMETAVEAAEATSEISNVSDTSNVIDAANEKLQINATSAADSVSSVSIAGNMLDKATDASHAEYIGDYTIFNGKIYDANNNKVGFIEQRGEEIVVLDEKRNPVSYRDSNGYLYDESHNQIGHVTSSGNTRLLYGNNGGTPAKMKKIGDRWTIEEPPTRQSDIIIQ